MTHSTETLPLPPRNWLRPTRRFGLRYIDELFGGYMFSDPSAPQDPVLTNHSQIAVDTDQDLYPNQEVI
jgi:hypothetical protein